MVGGNSGSDRQFVRGRMFSGEFHTRQLLARVLGRLVILEQLDERHLNLRLVPAFNIENAERIVETNGSTRSETHAFGAAGFDRPFYRFLALEQGRGNN